MLRPEQPFELHQSLHAAVFKGWDKRVLGPPPVWVPSAADVAGTNVAAFMDRFQVAAMRSGRGAGWGRGRGARRGQVVPLCVRLLLVRLCL